LFCKRLSIIWLKKEAGHAGPEKIGFFGSINCEMRQIRRRKQNGEKENLKTTLFKQ
jgi:hypothetical protein